MAFVRSKTKTYKFPVTYVHPSATDPNKDDVFKFVGVFRRLSKSEMSDLYKKAKKDKDLNQEQQLEKVEAMSLGEETLKFMAGWEEVTEEDGTPIPFTKQSLDELFEEYPSLYVTLSQTFADSQYESTRKKHRATV